MVVFAELEVVLVQPEVPTDPARPEMPDGEMGDAMPTDPAEPEKLEGETGEMVATS